MPKIKKQIIETHGQDESVKEKFQPTLLEQVWGADNLSRYGTQDESVYIKRLENMTRADIEAHARTMGVVIVEHTPRLRDKLLTEFRSYTSLSRRSATSTSQGQQTISEAARKVLDEGR